MYFFSFIRVLYNHFPIRRLLPSFSFQFSFSLIKLNYSDQNLSYPEPNKLVRNVEQVGRWRQKDNITSRKSHFLLTFLEDLPLTPRYLSISSSSSSPPLLFFVPPISLSFICDSLLASVTLSKYCKTSSS